MSERTNIPDMEGVTETIKKAAAAGQQAIEEGYEGARESFDEYVGKSLDYADHLSGGLAAFVRREPFMAMGAALLIGYLAAQFVRRLPA